QTRAGIHDEAAWARFRRPLAEVWRDEALPVHQRDIQMLEGCHRPAAAIGRQSGDRSPLQQEAQQLGLLEDACDELTVLEVVARKSGLVLGEHPVDFIHSLIRGAYRLAFTEQ